MTDSTARPAAPMPDSSPVRVAQCQCGRLRALCTGAPERISMCHCLACQRRTGSVFSANSRFRRDRVSVEGPATAYVRTADTGNTVTAWFCPTCGSTVYWERSGFPDVMAVAQGMFADPAYPAPTVEVWTESRHPWTECIADLPRQQFARMP